MPKYKSDIPAAFVTEKLVLGIQCLGGTEIFQTACN
jgi:hypothetical protein